MLKSHEPTEIKGFEVLIECSSSSDRVDSDDVGEPGVHGVCRRKVPGMRTMYTPHVHKINV